MISRVFLTFYTTCYFCLCYILYRWKNTVHLVLASLVAQTVKDLPVIQETQVQSLGGEDPLEKGMAIHSSILAWRIPLTEEPGGLQSTESQRVRQDWVTNTFTFFCKYHRVCDISPDCSRQVTLIGEEDAACVTTYLFLMRIWVISRCGLLQTVVLNILQHISWGTFLVGIVGSSVCALLSYSNKLLQMQALKTTQVYDTVTEVRSPRWILRG